MTTIIVHGFMGSLTCIQTIGMLVGVPAHPLVPHITLIYRCPCTDARTQRHYTHLCNLCTHKYTYIHKTDLLFFSHTTQTHTSWYYSKSTIQMVHSVSEVHNEAEAQNVALKLPLSVIVPSFFRSTPTWITLSAGKPSFVATLCSGGGLSGGKKLYQSLFSLSV